MADWQAIKTEYITTDTSYRKLALKYEVSYQAICHRSKEEGWIALREQHTNNTISKTLDKISKQESNRAARIYTVADKLLNKIEAMADSINTAKDLRALSAAIKDLKEIQGVKSDPDRREQEARIANLQRQADKDDDNKEPIQVIIGDDLAEYRK